MRVNSNTSILLPQSIPFVEIIFSCISDCWDSEKLDLPKEVKQKILTKLLKSLSFDAEVVLQNELENFINNCNGDFHSFVISSKTVISCRYPVLDNLLKSKTTNFFTNLSNIIHNLKNDYKGIIDTFDIKTEQQPLKIIDIETNIGDGHNGEHTAIVSLSNGTKLVYKPRNVGITIAYNDFIKWLNDNLNVNLRVFKIMDCGKYGWLEFISYNEADTAEDLQEYYYKSGILLAVAYLLGSKDCHRENVIASGKDPVLIDHETIIQPLLLNILSNSWDIQHMIPPFSVLESLLILNLGTGISSDLAGYGVNKQVEVTELEKKVINPNTTQSKRTTRFITRKIAEKNIPVLNGKLIFVSNFKEHFIEGFSQAYDLFSNHANHLKSVDSPIALFENNEVRYVWRPTFVYFKILKYMRAPSYMSDFKIYNAKMLELLSKAYEINDMQQYKFILNSEINQMLKGDIPIFNLGSLDNSMKENQLLKLFKYNCIENITHRINLLSPTHKQEQLQLINKWINI